MKRLAALATLLAALAIGAVAHAKPLTAVEAASRTAQLQIRNLLEPLLSRYCGEQCKLLAVNVSIELASPEEIAPGFDDIDPASVMDLAPSMATARVLLDEKLGANTSRELIQLLQQHLDTLDYPVKIDTQAVRFPQPAGTAGKIAELRERVTKRFKGALDELFAQFCPNQCLLVDYELRTDTVSAEETNYGGSGEYFEDGGVAIRVRSIAGTILVDDTLNPEAQANILEMAKLKTNFLHGVDISQRVLHFPRPPGELVGGGLVGNGYTYGASGVNSKTDNKTDSKSDSKSNTETNSQSLSKNDSRNTTTSRNTTNENNLRQEHFERFEKIERVESGDAVQKELEKFKVFGLVFACSVLSLLLFVALAAWKQKSSQSISIQRALGGLRGSSSSTDSLSAGLASGDESTGTIEGAPSTTLGGLVARRLEIQSLRDELMGIFAQNPRVARHVFSRILTEEGVETTAMYMHIFGDSIIVDMLHDPSLQTDLSELMEYYAKTPIELSDEEQLELLKLLHNRTVAGKLFVMGSRSSNLFDFLHDMDGMQIMELVRNESLTVKSIVLTQVDPQKRTAIYSQMDEDMRFKLMTELSRIDYLPRDYIFNVANALKRKRKENPRLNTEALPGSDVLLTLLERANPETQRTVVKNLELSNPESARNIKAKLVSLETIRYLRDGQLLEVVLSLKHDELLQFLKGAPTHVRDTIFLKAPRDLVAELEDELGSVAAISREVYQAVERKLLNRVKIMSQEGLVNLVETNDRMLGEGGTGTQGGTAFIEAGPAQRVA